MTGGILTTMKRYIQQTQDLKRQCDHITVRAGHSFRTVNMNGMASVKGDLNDLQRFLSTALYFHVEMSLLAKNNQITKTYGNDTTCLSTTILTFFIQIQKSNAEGAYLAQFGKTASSLSQ